MRITIASFLTSQIVLAVVLLAGWVMNIVTLAYQPELEFTGMTVLRVAGIFIPPLGGVLGYI